MRGWYLVHQLETAVDIVCQHHACSVMHAASCMCQKHSSIEANMLHALTLCVRVNINIELRVHLVLFVLLVQLQLDLLVLLPVRVE